jgi:hypothetical protein
MAQIEINKKALSQLRDKVVIITGKFLLSVRIL